MRTTTAICTAAATIIAGTALFTASRAIADDHQTQPSQQPAPARVATMNTLSLLEAALQSEDLRTARDEEGQRWQSQLQEISTQLQALEREAGLLGPQDPGRQQLAQQFNQLRQRGQQLQVEAQQAIQSINAQQAARAFEEISQKGRELALARGYTHLISKRDDLAIEVPDGANAFATVTQEILARAVVLAPEGDDITETVREELDLPTEEEIEALAEEDEADAPAVNELDGQGGGG